METYVCDLGVNGWQMYSYEGEAEMSRERARAKRRAASLSKRLTKLVHKAQERLRKNPQLSEHKLAVQIRDKMHKLMSKYGEDGAADTEPQCVLVSELERAFGLDPYSLERW